MQQKNPSAAKDERICFRGTTFIPQWRSSPDIRHCINNATDTQGEKDRYAALQQITAVTGNV
ncbi:hypothetical protein GCM10023310_36720 [Paenibacillus vulneris]